MVDSLNKLQQQEPLSEKELFTKKRNGWINEGILVVTKKQRDKLSLSEHDAIMSIGKKLYGY
jgi:hypothetical protein